MLLVGFTTTLQNSNCSMSNLFCFVLFRLRSELEDEVSEVDKAMEAEKESLRLMLSRSGSTTDTVPISRRERDAIIMPASETGDRGKLLFYINVIYAYLILNVNHP